MYVSTIERTLHVHQPSQGSQLYILLKCLCFDVRQDEAEEEDVTLFFEDDIVLTRDQARLLLSDFRREESSSGRRRTKRKLDEELVKRWRMPIAYMFDGAHSKTSMLLKN